VRKVYLETSFVSYLTARPSRDLAIATVHGMDFLLTWNFRHIANAERREAVATVCRTAGYAPPVICTPEELDEDGDD
jgi:hypothetical protein